MAFTRSYYWRAVRAIARAEGISTKEARGRDWRAYAEADRAKRSEAAQLGAETRARRDREARSSSTDEFGYSDVWVVEEPIDEVGGRFYK